MADYYPLLARAVAGLQDSNPEARRAVYGRARTAMMAQLRKMTPALDDQEIEQESRALDEAVERLEREFGAAELELAATGTTAEAGRVGRASTKESAGRGLSANVSPAGPAGKIGERPLPAALRDRNKGPAAPLPAPKTSPRADGRPAAPQQSRPRGTESRFWIVGVTVLVVAGVIAFTAWRLRDRPEDLAHMKTAAVAHSDDGGGKILGRADAPPAAASNPIPTVQVATVPIRPTAPAAPASTAPSPPPAPPPAPSTATAGPAPRPGEPAPAAAASTTAPPAPEAAAPKPSAPPAAAAPAPAAPASAPVQSASAAPAAASPPAAAPAGQPAAAAQPATAGIPVAYRAALLVASPDDPQNIKTYVGTAVWRIDNVSGDQGQPLSVAVRADIDIPEAKLKASMTLKKNTDPAFQASHTMVIGFNVQSGGPVAGIKEIKFPQLRNEDAPSGDALASVGVVPIIDNFFLVGLAQASAQQNLDLIRSRGWFDVPLALADGKVAKITFEKGVQGDHAIADAIAAWQ